MLKFVDPWGSYQLQNRLQATCLIGRCVPHSTSWANAQSVQGLPNIIFGALEESLVAPAACWNPNSFGARSVQTIADRLLPSRPESQCFQFGRKFVEVWPKIYFQSRALIFVIGGHELITGRLDGINSLCQAKTSGCQPQAPRLSFSSVNRSSTAARESIYDVPHS